MPKNIAEILMAGTGMSKLASVPQQGGGPSREELEKAAAMAAAGTTVEALTKEAEEKLAGQMAYLGYCFGWGLNKAAMEWQDMSKAGNLGAANLASNEAKGPPAGVGDPTSHQVNDAGAGALAENTSLRGSGNPAIAGALERLIKQRRAQGAQSDGGQSMNAGEQKTSADRAQAGARFRQILLQRLGNG